MASVRAAAAAFGLAFLLAFPGHAADTGDAARLSFGSGSFVFPFFSAGAAREITVWYHRPEGAGANAPIVFVMHGDGRDAVNYRKNWVPFADERGFVLLVPEYSREHFATSRNYNLGDVTARDGTRRPEAEWSYTAIEDIFDAVRTANAFSASAYDIYGHSAGGQFVHRLVLLKPGARYRVAVAANAGWYLMPDAGIAYPYGLAGAGIDAGQLSQALGRRLIVLLGDRDIDADHRSLRRSPGAMAQGRYRLGRGHAFFERARLAAAEINAPFAWTMHVAHGVAHSNAAMASHAASFLGARNPGP